MRVLALDTTTRAGSVAIIDDHRVVVESIGDPARSHAERLPSDVMTALDLAECLVSDIDLFAVASGPGSFTGLRIGIATIQGLAFVTGRRVVPVSALEALAMSASGTSTAGTIVGAWMDAHRGEVFSALYRVTGDAVLTAGRLDEVEGPAVSTPVETLARWERLGSTPAIVVGDGAVLYQDMLAARISSVPPQPLGAVIARIALARSSQSVSPSGIQPLYVRRPDAEVARDARQADDPSRAKAL